LWFGSVERKGVSARKIPISKSSDTSQPEQTREWAVEPASLSTLTRSLDLFTI
jgi:hypothetical protein